MVSVGDGARRFARLLVYVFTFIAGAASVLGLQYSLRSPGAGITTASYGDWRLTCPPHGQRNASCQLSQELVRRETGIVIARFSVTQTDGKNRLTIIVPHGVLLKSGLGFAIGARPPQNLAYETCDALGCIVSVPLEGEIASDMRESGDGRISVADRNGNSSTLQYSLRGFGDGITALDRDAFRRSWGLDALGV